MDGQSLKNDETNKMKDEDEIIIRDEEVDKLMQTLPITTVDKIGVMTLVNYQGFWYPGRILKAVLAYQKHFQARNSDIIIASCPKTGNTWLKALLFAIVNRGTPKLNLLLEKHPHELVHHLESDVYNNAFDYLKPCNLDKLSDPRVFSTHLPYHSLPESVKTSGCRILSLTRNPLDTFVSLYYFGTSSFKKMAGDNEDFEFPTFEDYFDKFFYQGKSSFGPFLDHVKGYWEKSLEQTYKIRFLMYEDLQGDLMIQVKSIAEFVGFPISPEEESEGVVRKIVELCNIDNLKELDANKNGVISNFYEKKSYFRKGKVGDWRNHFSDDMVDQAMKFMEDKIGASGLSFKFDSSSC